MFYLKKFNSVKFQPNEKSCFYQSSHLSCIPVSHRKRHISSHLDSFQTTTRIFHFLK